MKNIYALAILAAFLFSAASAEARPFSVAQTQIGDLSIEPYTVCQKTCNLSPPVTVDGIPSYSSWLVYISFSWPNGQPYPIEGIFQVFDNPTNDPNASQASQAACVLAAQKICGHLNAHPEYENCDAIRLSGGEAVLHPVTVSCR